MATILLYESVPQPWFDAFAEFLHGQQPRGLPLNLVQADADDLEHKLALLRDAEILVVGLTGQRHELGRSVLEKAQTLRLIQKIGSRIAGVDVEAAREAGICVCLAPSPAHVACAEHTILLILALARKLVAARKAMTRRPAKGEDQPEAGTDAYNWADMQDIGLVAGRTLGLVGIGDIAIETARRAAALGMNVLYHDPAPLPQDEDEALGIQPREFDDLLAESDVVSLHVALTPASKGLINTESLAKMKPSAYLVNTARGGLVDEEALATALSAGALAGAALDAWAAEPTPRGNPLLKLDNVVATPHIAAGTLPTTALFEAVVPNILAALRGDPLDGCLTPGIVLEPVPLQEPEEEPEPEAEPEPSEADDADTEALDEEQADAERDDEDEPEAEDADEPEADKESADAPADEEPDDESDDESDDEPDEDEEDADEEPP